MILIMCFQCDFQSIHVKTIYGTQGSAPRVLSDDFNLSVNAFSYLLSPKLVEATSRVHSKTTDFFLVLINDVSFFST